jgi:hypothetical protein
LFLSFLSLLWFALFSPVFRQRGSTKHADGFSTTPKRLGWAGDFGDPSIALTGSALAGKNLSDGRGGDGAFSGPHGLKKFSSFLKI